MKTPDLKTLTPFWYLFCQLSTEFKHWPGVCIVGFEQENAVWDKADNRKVKLILNWNRIWKWMFTRKLYIPHFWYLRSWLNMLENSISYKTWLTANQSKSCFIRSIFTICCGFLLKLLSLPYCIFFAVLKLSDTHRVWY